MGREVKTTVADGKTRAEARLHLDSELLTIGPPFRLKIPLEQVTRCASTDDGLEVEAGPHGLRIALTVKEAAAWVKSIENPPSLATKLGLKPGIAVATVGPVPDEIAGLTPDARTFARLPKTLPAALVFAGVPGTDPAKLGAAMAPGAAVWLVYEKGVTNGDAVIAAARAAGLKDTKVAKVSERFAALRFIASK